MRNGRRCRSPTWFRGRARPTMWRKSNAFAKRSSPATRFRAPMFGSTACRAMPWVRCSISASKMRPRPRRRQPLATRSRASMRIAVLGGGNGSFAAAGDLVLAGHEVRLWRRDDRAVVAHLAAGGHIIIEDFRGRHASRPALITTDIAQAVRGAELIVCPTPATTQSDIAARLAPHLGAGQVVFLPPGTFGSVLFAKAAYAAGNRAEVAFAETGTLPWLTRKHAPFEAAITIRAKRLPTGVFPLRVAEPALAVIARAFPGVIEACGDALSASLMNAGPIIHRSEERRVGKGVCSVRVQW